MRKLVFAVMMLVVSNGFAASVGASDTWGKILRSSDVLVDTPKITMKNWFIPVFGACINGDLIRSKETVTECVKYSNGGHNHDGKCLETVERTLSTPRTVTEAYCKKMKGGKNGGDCLEVGYYTHTIPTSYDISVYTHRLGKNEGPGQFLFAKHFDIPACK